ncbi:hypothetical protein [Spirosoma fluviale]|uniref:Uncharacterized protein n=1 Tax=Spirosoma fluviale TaxID=1597977 RepID=A0A286G866_9BACT|nr:hypothetical protein [Spirosoma fluviale]SOD91740.1 hypothetical protein SAMN06269250_3616 [Spirosoma fluviale]
MKNLRLYFLSKRKPFSIVERVSAFLFVLIALSCGRTNTGDIAPDSLLTAKQYSLVMSKALYSSMQLSNYNLKSTKADFISTVSKDENDVIRNTASSLSNNERFNNLFNSQPLANARSSASDIGSLNLDNIKTELNSPIISDNVRKKIIQFGGNLTSLKTKLNQNSSTDPNTVKFEVGQLVSNFEDDITKDASLSLDEKTKIFSFTIPLHDNLENVKQLLTGVNSGGRLAASARRCWLCNIVNVFVTVVVAVVVVAVAVIVIVAAAEILISGDITTSTSIAAGAFGAAVGAILGVVYVFTQDTCLHIVDYGQTVYPGTLVGFSVAQC